MASVNPKKILDTRPERWVGLIGADHEVESKRTGKGGIKKEVDPLHRSRGKGLQILAHLETEEGEHDDLYL